MGQNTGQSITLICFKRYQRPVYIEAGLTSNLIATLVYSFLQRLITSSKTISIQSVFHSSYTFTLLELGIGLCHYYEETFIIDDIDLGVSSDGNMLNFTLHDIDKNALEKSIHPSRLSNYIVGINIIDSVSAGRKKNTGNVPRASISRPTATMPKVTVQRKTIPFLEAELYVNLILNLKTIIRKIHSHKPSTAKR